MEARLIMIVLTYDGQVFLFEKKWCGEQFIKRTKSATTPQATVMPRSDQHSAVLSLRLWVKSRLTNNASETFESVYAKMKSTSAAYMDYLGQSTRLSHYSSWKHTSSMLAI